MCLAYFKFENHDRADGVCFCIVAVIAPNAPAVYETYFGVPMAGAVVNCVNIRLNAGTVVFLLEDEWQSIALGYTSGTTAIPKGVLLNHRGAYLMSLSNPIIWRTNEGAVYLWTLPMFHCNGWCFTWTLDAICGASICPCQDSPAVFCLEQRLHRLDLFYEFLVQYFILICAVVELTYLQNSCATCTEQSTGNSEGSLFSHSKCWCQSLPCCTCDTYTIINASKEETTLPLPRLVHVMTAGVAPPPSAHFAMSEKDHETRPRRWKNHGRNCDERQFSDEGLLKEPKSHQGSFCRWIMRAGASHLGQMPAYWVSKSRVWTPAENSDREDSEASPPGQGKREGTHQGEQVIADDKAFLAC
ncbi:hypothetical protein POTOM_036251 [Populus tomentosa]|uniref:AMP-dependent synthetase/ligase domain-containing protein n=1 Tax=Populus tomentosa TaxID=118781 RepID=A0A8X7Z1V7_POPTO|nr:hypothetical protein POTOM_036251 [Populus tomentosa]